MPETETASACQVDVEESRANNAIQNTTKWTFSLSRNYTHMMCLQDLHIFANKIASIASAASLQSHGTFLVLQATESKHLGNCEYQPYSVGESSIESISVNTLPRVCIKNCPLKKIM